MFARCHRLPRFPSARAAWIVRGGLLVWMALSGAFAVRAHDTLASSTIARLRQDTITLRTKIIAEAAWGLAENVGGYSSFQPEEFDQLKPAWNTAARDFFEVTSAGTRASPQSSSADLLGDDLILNVTYPIRRDAPLRLEARFLRQLAPEAHVSVVVFDEANTQLGAKILQGEDRVLEIGPGATSTGDAHGAAAPPPRPSFGEYLRLGVHHILSGYDHLLFLGALLVACRRFRSMLTIVTCFTLAHSLTLALAALERVTFSARVIEPLIAATIVFVAVENLLRREEPRGRWALTFGFGLIHGFGFAGVLKESGLGAGGSGLVAPLFAFNLGVELGQLAVIAVFLPLLFLLRKRSPAFARYGPSAISAAVAVAGGYWLLQRTVFA